MALCPYVTPRLAEWWEDPETFDLERFSEERSQGRPRFAYFPFGGGPRQCIGLSMGTLEALFIVTLPAGTRAGIYCSAETGLQPKTRSHDLRDPSAALVGGRHAATWRGLQPAASRLLSMPGALNSSP